VRSTIFLAVMPQAQASAFKRFPPNAAPSWCILTTTQIL
jgi:hypothetical protein